MDAGRGGGANPPQPPVNLIFGDYAVICRLGEGGMGVVYKAEQRDLNRIVALKMLRSGSLASESEIKRFRAEARAAANLQHPNVVAIHEVGEEGGQLFFSMDYVEGESLAQMVRRAPLAPERAAGYVKTIAEAIHYAHLRGVLHRDLKPANVLIDANDQPRITDFGLAKYYESDSDLTASGAVLGTPSYMPPEQAAGGGGRVGPASDVYSLGAILYDLLTGRPPFRADTPVETLRQVLDSEPAPLRLINPNIPRDLETICLKCLSKMPGRRYGTAQELVEDLGRFLNEEPIRARRVGWLGHLFKWSRRDPAAAGLSLTLIVLMVLMTMAALWFRQDALRGGELSAGLAARMLGGELQQLALIVDSVASKPELAELIRSGEEGLLTNLLEASLKDYGARAPEWLVLQNWAIMGTNGVLVARWPWPGTVLTNRVSRDYYDGAMDRLGGRGLEAVHFSKVYLSMDDGYFKFGVSRVIRDSAGATAGVIALMVRTINLLDALGPAEERNLVLIGRWDRSSSLGWAQVAMPWREMFLNGVTVGPGKESRISFRPEFVILAHPAFGTNNIVVPADELLSELSTNAGSTKRIETKAWPYRDPVGQVNGRYMGRWLAGVSPVPGTDFVVIYQTRDRVVDALMVAGGFGGLGGLVIGVWRFWKRRERRTA